MILANLNLCVTVMPPIKFWLSRIYGFEEMSVAEFKEGRHGGHHGYRNGMILAVKFCSIRLTVWEMSFEEFQDGRRGCHHGYRNGTILAILNLCVTVMPPIKFWLNQHKYEI